MYDNILHKPLQIQGTKTIAACDILQGLLHKDKKKRLGAKTDFVRDTACRGVPVIIAHTLSC